MTRENIRCLYFRHDYKSRTILPKKGAGWGSNLDGHLYLFTLVHCQSSRVSGELCDSIVWLFLF